ncbi:hypothetical protein [Providencia sp. SKLX146130]|uniref:hypothetical protein n=1 Tax=Providencia zhejiangensis TaxID=3342829 RepID=UPI0035C2167B
MIQIIIGIVILILAFKIFKKIFVFTLQFILGVISLPFYLIYIFFKSISDAPKKKEIRNLFIEKKEMMENGDYSFIHPSINKSNVNIFISEIDSISTNDKDFKIKSENLLANFIFPEIQNEFHINEIVETSLLIEITTNKLDSVEYEINERRILALSLKGLLKRNTIRKISDDLWMSLEDSDFSNKLERITIEL